MTVERMLEITTERLRRRVETGHMTGPVGDELLAASSSSSPTEAAALAERMLRAIREADDAAA